MFTVVIPTMLKFFPFKQFLKTLAIYAFSDKSKIGEIIIINNSEQKDLDKEFAEYKEKIKFLSYGINIGCNPAWNIGVQYAKYDKICLLNDDVIFDLTLFDKLDLLNNLETGIVGLCPGVKDFNQPPFINGEIKILPWNHEHTYGYGCLMFIHKKNYIPIPKELKIYYGDNWLFDLCLNNRKTNYIITDLVHYTPYATTVSSLSKTIIEEEDKIYQEKFKSESWAISIFNIEEDKALSVESDIKDNLTILKNYALNSKSILELGVRTGLSTRIFLNSNLEKLVSIDLVEDYYVRDLFNVAELVDRNWKYLIENSLDYNIEEKFDLLFIDTDHNYSQIKKELKKYHNFINKYIIFHDTFSYGIKKEDEKDPGILPAILEFLEENKEWEIEYTNCESNGILIIRRKNA